MPPEEWDFEVPADFQDQSADIVGYWAKQGSLLWVPEDVRLIDNNLRPEVCSALIGGRLVRPARIHPKDEKDEVVTVPAGTYIGVWYSPGMKGLSELRGVEVFMRPDGEMEMDKGKNPMKLFQVRARTKGRPLPVVADYRVHSKDQVPPIGLLPNMSPATRSDLQAPADDLPF